MRPLAVGPLVASPALSGASTIGPSIGKSAFA